MIKVKHFYGYSWTGWMNKDGTEKEYINSLLKYYRDKMDNGEKNIKNIEYKYDNGIHRIMYLSYDDKEWIECENIFRMETPLD